MLSRVSYVFREMWASLSRNRTLTAAAMITATVSLFLSGMTLLIQKGFDNQLSTWTEGVELVVYVNAKAPQDQVDLIEKTLNDNKTLVAGVNYCDAPCSMEVARAQFAGQTPPRLTEDTIPTMFRVTPVTKDRVDLLRGMIDSIKGIPGVRNVQTPDAVIATIGALKNFLGLRSLIMSIVLLLAAVLLIWNSIRTAMFARRREIEVMKLVGATNWFIRLPFMLEGLVQGLVGGLLAGGALLYVNNDWTDGVRSGFDQNSGLTGFVVSGNEPLTIAMAMVALGAIVGAIGSATAASKFLDV